MIEAAVVDASVVVKWLVDERDAARAAGLRSSILSAPEILLAECGNALWAKERRGEISEHEAAAALEALEVAPLTLVSLAELSGAALSLAFHLRHPIYDCLYVALAIRTDVPVVTADRRLIGTLRASEELAHLVMPLDELPA